MASKKHILKTYQGRIFIDFLVHEEPVDSILILEGFPSSCEHSEQIRFLYNKGYNVFWPHYPGSFQSKGYFLDKNPVKEFSGLIKKLGKGELISLWDLSRTRFGIKRLFIFASSFSGAIAMGIAASVDIDGLVLFSPVLDYYRHNENGDEQDLDQLVRFIKRAYKNLYRIKWNSLKRRITSFKECDPEEYTKRVKAPILVLHDPRDR
ncbi:hypothetical protein DRZ77_03140, partial [Candidatus Woesearchaeota archaeon]